MSKSKRFKIVHLNLKRLDMCDIQDTAQETPTFYNDLGHISSVEPVCELLNKLNDENEQLQEEIKRLEKMIWKIQWRFQQEVGIEKAREHYREIDKEMNE